MNFPHVHDKLAEASFFLHHLDQEQVRTTSQRQGDAFRFYLSAFQNATYSTCEYLERYAKEMLKEKGAQQHISGKKSKAKYDKWRNEWIENLSLADKKVWYFMTKNRGEEVHVGRAETVKEAKAIPADNYSTRNAYAYYGNSTHASHCILAIIAGDEGGDLMAQEKRRLGLPGWCNVWTYTETHNL